MNHVAGIQRQLVEKDLDALLITDEKNQRYAAGFPITDGAVLVTREKASPSTAIWPAPGAAWQAMVSVCC